jgi:hypothetical protein
MRRMLVVLAVLVFTACRATRECRGTITGPEFHKDTVQLRCR